MRRFLKFTRGKSAAFAALAALVALAVGCVSRIEFVPPLKLLGPWVNLTSNLVTLQNGCVEVLGVRPDEDVLLAAVVDNGAFALPAGATIWQALGTAVGSGIINNDPFSLVFDPGRPGTFWETGIHRGGGIFQTSDGGQSFTALGNSFNNDLVSVDFTDPQRKTMLAGVHEAGVHALLSRDSGSTWTDLGPRLPAGAGDTSWPLVFDEMTFLLGSNNGMASGIFRTTDGGETWSQVSSTPVHSHPLLSSTGAIYWMVAGNGGVIVSNDQGKTWAAPVASGITVTVVPGLVELPDGRLAAPGLVYLLISSDQAKTWAPLSVLPYAPFGLVYSPVRKSFFIWDDVCTTVVDGGVVPSGDVNGVLALPFDYQTQ